MLNKKGIGSEIDWILGAGLFFLSVTFIFVLFRPGIVPVHDSQTLLNIVQDGFEKDTSWSIKMNPIFIVPVYSDNFDSERVIRLTDRGYDINANEEGSSPGNNYYDQLEDLISRKEEENIKIFYFALDTDDDAPGRGIEPLGSGDIVEIGEEDRREDREIHDLCSRDISEFDTSDPRFENWMDFIEIFCDDDGENFGNARSELTIYGTSDAPIGVPLGAERDYQLEFNKIENELIFSSNLKPDKTKYALTVSDKPINFDIGSDLSVGSLRGCYAFSEDGDISLESSPALERDPSIDYEDKCEAIYEFGAREELTGIHYPTLFELEDFAIDDSGCGKGYRCLKEAWNFPEAKEFMIEIESIPEGTVGSGSCNPKTGQLCYKFPAKSVEPPQSQNINVFVRQFNRFILTDDGEKIPVIVRLTVW